MQHLGGERWGGGLIAECTKALIHEELRLISIVIVSIAKQSVMSRKSHGNTDNSSYDESWCFVKSTAVTLMKSEIYVCICLLSTCMIEKKKKKGILTSFYTKYQNPER